MFHLNMIVEYYGCESLLWSVPLGYSLSDITVILNLRYSIGHIDDTAMVSHAFSVDYFYGVHTVIKRRQLENKHNFAY